MDECGMKPQATDMWVLNSVHTAPSSRFYFTAFVSWSSLGLPRLQRHSQRLSKASTLGLRDKFFQIGGSSMAIAAAQLAASSVTAQFLTSSAAVSHCSPSGISFAPLSARRSPPLCGSLRIGVRKANGDRLARVRLLPIRAAASEEAGEEFVKQAEEVLSDLKAKWDGVGNKSTVAIFGSGALLALWFSSTVVNTINNLPLLPNLMELIGLGYSAWFVYRYLLFQDNRKELASEIKELKRKITGATDDVSS